MIKFPSPTGVNHYECSISDFGEAIAEGSFRPQQGLTIMNGKKVLKFFKNPIEFPSPTGVNHYEFY